jgi:hypothetical protein
MEAIMPDPTAAARVRRYRKRQRRQRGIKRVEVQVPAAATDDIKNWSSKLREAYKRAGAAARQVDFVLGTINAPRRVPIDAGTLIHCLTAIIPEKQWRPHVEALFDEVSEEAVHDLVLAKIVSFEDLYRAARTWRVTHGRIFSWVREMADLRLLRATEYAG